MNYIFEPALKSPEQAYTLVLLHGTGGNERSLLPLLKRLGEGFVGQFNVLSVRGNVLENGMPRFFKRLSEGVFDEEDVRFRADELFAFLTHIADELGIDALKMVAIGYSNGANIAGALLQRYPHFLMGAALLRPMIPLRDDVVFPNGKDTPVLLLSGEFDPLEPKGEVEHWAQILGHNGFFAEHHRLEASHQVTSEDLSLMANWLAQHFENLTF
jgi:phospholipase/carboxylesterase